VSNTKEQGQLVDACVVLNLVKNLSSEALEEMLEIIQQEIEDRRLSA